MSALNRAASTVLPPPSVGEIQAPPVADPPSVRGSSRKQMSSTVVRSVWPKESGAPIISS